MLLIIHIYICISSYETNTNISLLRLGQTDAEQLLGVEGAVWGETEQQQKKEEEEAKTSHA